MEALPREIVRVLRVFEDVFSERIWDWVQVLVVTARAVAVQSSVVVRKVNGFIDCSKSYWRTSLPKSDAGTETTETTEDTEGMQRD